MKTKVTFASASASVLVCILIIVLSLSAVCPVAGAAGPGVDVIIVFKGPVTPEDVKYIEGLGGIVKYTYTIVDGLAASLPRAALDRLRNLQDSPGSDPVAGQIKYIENDGIMHVMGGSGTSGGQNPVTIQV